MREVVALLCCVLSVLVSGMLGKRCAEELVEPVKGFEVVATVVSAITALASFIEVTVMAACGLALHTEVLTAEQLAWHVLSDFWLLVVIVWSWLWSWLQNALASIPLGLSSYIMAYAVTLLEEQAAPYMAY